jgi:hypothetical protein
VNFLHSFYIFSAVPFFLLLLLSPLFRKKYRIWKFIFVFFPHTMTVAEQMKNTSGSASQQLLTSTKIKEGMNMANRSSNTAAVPEAKGALDKFKLNKIAAQWPAKAVA